MELAGMALKRPRVVGDGNVEVDIELGDSGVSEVLRDRTFVTKYSQPVSDCPDAILLIPAIANLSMASWALGADLTVPIIDTEFFRSIKHIRDEFAKWYPSLKNGGGVHAERIESIQPHPGSDSLLYFSGGVDSLASYIRHEVESPALVALHGADIKLGNSEAWENARSQLNGFADRESVEFATIRSNFKEVFDGGRIIKKIPEEVIGGWWGGIQHGLGMISLSAPIAFQKGYGKGLY